MSLITVWAVFTVYVCNISQYLTSIRELSWLWRACMSIWANESAVGRSLPLFLNEKKYSITFQNTVKHWSVEYNLKKRGLYRTGMPHQTAKGQGNQHGTRVAQFKWTLPSTQMVFLNEAVKINVENTLMSQQLQHWLPSVCPQYSEKRLIKYVCG